MELLNSKKTMLIAGAAATAAALLTYYMLSATPCPPRGICPPNQYQFNSGTKTYCLPCP